MCPQCDKAMTFDRHHLPSCKVQNNSQNKKKTQLGVILKIKECLNFRQILQHGINEQTYMQHANNRPTMQVHVF